MQKSRMTDPNIPRSARQPHHLLPVPREPGCKPGHFRRGPAFGLAALAREEMASRIEERSRFAAYVRERDKQEDAPVPDVRGQPRIEMKRRRCRAATSDIKRNDILSNEIVRDGLKRTIQN